MAFPKVLAWNCAGLRASSDRARQKALYFEKEHKNDFHFAFFIETHHKSENEIPPEIRRYDNTHHIVHSAVLDETHAGIIGLISKEYEILDVKHLIQGRILNLKMRNQNDNSMHNIFVVYFETNNHLTKMKIVNIVEEMKKEIEDHPNNMIIGDFNFIDHEKDKINGLNSKDKMITDIWKPFLEEHDMVDPYREQNPKRKIWSFIGTGAAGKSRIDRIYVNSVNMKNITNIQYITTPFGGHKLLSFIKTATIEIGKGYYKLNTSILKDQQYQELVKNAVEEVKTLNGTDIERWITFLSIIKSESISYSQKKNKVKRSLKAQIKNDLNEIEQKDTIQDPDPTNDSARYTYLQQKLKELEESEIEGYKMRIKYLPSFDKDEPDIAFYSKIEEKVKKNATITQLAENENDKIYTDNKNIMRIATKFYSDLYTPNKVNQKTQDRLLRNIKKKISQEEKEKLDAPVSEPEL